MESWKVSTPGAVTHQWYDQYGNCCHTLTVAQPVTELAIKVSGLVRTRDTNGVVGLAPAELPLGLYLRETSYTVCSEPIRAYAARFRSKANRDRIEALHEIMLAIADDVEYTKGETHVHTTGAEAWSRAAASARTMPIFSVPSADRSISRRAMSAVTCRTRRMLRATPGPTPTWKISAG